MRRLWLYGALTVLACSLLVGAGGYSTMAADRGVNVAVADDSSAYLGIDDRSVVHLVDDGSSETALGLTDNFAESDPSVSASVPGEAPIEVTGASFSEGVEVSCKRVENRASVPIGLTATGSDTTVKVTRSVTVTCEAPPIEAEDITWLGCGNAKIDAHVDRFPLEVTLFWANGANSTTEVAANESVRSHNGSQGRGPITGIEIQSTDLSVDNPTCQPGSGGNGENG